MLFLINFIYSAELNELNALFREAVPFVIAAHDLVPNEYREGKWHSPSIDKKLCQINEEVIAACSDLPSAEIFKLTNNQNPVTLITNFYLEILCRLEDDKKIKIIADKYRAFIGDFFGFKLDLKLNETFDSYKVIFLKNAIVSSLAKYIKERVSEYRDRIYAIVRDNPIFYETEVFEQKMYDYLVSFEANEDFKNILRRDFEAQINGDNNNLNRDKTIGDFYAEKMGCEQKIRDEISNCIPKLWLFFGIPTNEDIESVKKENQGRVFLDYFRDSDIENIRLYYFHIADSNTKNKIELFFKAVIRDFFLNSDLTLVANINLWSIWCIVFSAEKAAVLHKNYCEIHKYSNQIAFLNTKNQNNKLIVSLLSLGVFSGFLRDAYLKK